MVEIPRGAALTGSGGRARRRSAGAVFADDLSPQKARILLMLALQTTRNAQELQRMFDR